MKDAVRQYSLTLSCDFKRSYRELRAFKIVSRNKRTYMVRKRKGRKKKMKNLVKLGSE